jgi:serine/threonine protein kinase/Tfp pilus assembly protein PilF
MIGKTISHYRILEKLGEGGMGVVYKAEDTNLRRIVALKFLHPEFTRDAAAKERFIHEAQAASALDHPDICTIHEIGESEGQIFIVMACVEGESLEEEIRRGPLKLSEAVAIALHVAQGLQAAHEKQIVHRDIKSANVMVTPSRQIKIMDFGLAKLPGRTKLTTLGTTLGTTGYMSPEQAKGDEVDHRTDLWSLGVVLYEMVVGRPPFRGEYEQAIIYQIMNAQPESITSLRTGVPMELEHIVSKCLEKAPAERYQTAADLVADLRHLERAMSAEAPGQALPPTAPRKAARRIRWWYWAVPLAVFGAISAIIFFRMPSQNTGQRQKSIAVLPFKNMSDSKDEEYFSDGITEDIIAQLSKISDLKVISRTSIMGYKNSSKKIRDIGRELGVATVLEGSVRQADSRVRIVAQLIDARNEGHLWAETYDKEMTQIFAIQSDVAQKIAAALKATLLPAEKELIEKSPTQNLTAYDYYLRGREYYYRYSRENNEAAISLFKKALALDSRYALAYAGLGDAYGQRANRYGYSPGWLDSAIASSERAISYDPKLAEGFKALGLAYELKGWFNKSLDAYRKALALKPNYAPALGNIGWIELFRGNLAESAELNRRALTMDPGVAFNYLSLAFAHFVLNDDTKAMNLCREALDLQPDIIMGYFGVSTSYLVEQRYQEAIEQSEKALAIDPRDFMALTLAGDVQLFSGNLGKAKGYCESALAVDSFAMNMVTCRSPLVGIAYIQWKTGDRDEAHRVFTRVIERDMEGLARGNILYEIPYELACINAIRGDKAHAYEWLQKAIDAGWRLHRLGVIDPLLENLRDDDRFKRMMAQVKAMVDEQRKRLQEMEQE